MKNKGIVLICDNEDEHLNEVRNALENEGYSIEIITDASDLIPRAIRVRPGVLIVNPDLKAFNAYDVCKHILKDMDVPAIMIVEKNATARAQIDECEIEDVLTKPVNIRNLLNLISKHLTVAH
ncbi:response regulator [Chitinophagaceae bacterium LB-8]|uniref:Response regulator n=1 Tax=Paraflavisolibacter caeni TaxID=2982496 RepID=A0A9X2Y0M5_9BACT|nr:response regulator [Paraflavisolibacter caeni]MCU7552436.1 response regulator [Paraflavisolibacter caeni]